MPTHLSPESTEALDQDEQEVLRALNRSPHPYHHQSSELPYPSDHLVSRGERTASPKLGNESSQPSLSGLPTFSKESTPASDSGTDADDEHFLKGLPPPKLRPHKGLRGRNEVISGTSTPLLSPAVLQEPVPPTSRRASHSGKKSEERVILPDIIRRKKILVQRAIEVGIITTLAGLIQANKLLAPVLRTWRKGASRPFSILWNFFLTSCRFLSLWCLVWRVVAAVSDSSCSMELQESPGIFDLAAKDSLNLRPCAPPLSSVNNDICVTARFRQQPSSYPSQYYTWHKLDPTTSCAETRSKRCI